MKSSGHTEMGSLWRHLYQIPWICSLFPKEKKASNLYIANVDDFFLYVKIPFVLIENGDKHLFACQSSDIMTGSIKKDLYAPVNRTVKVSFSRISGQHMEKSF